MHTPEQITYMMQELGIDPNNAEARKVVERLAAAKPNVPIDDRFIALLREDIQAQASTFATSETKPKNLIANFMNKILASALVVALVLVGGSVWYIQSTDQPLFRTNLSGDADQILSGKYGVTTAEEESFGDLAKVAIVANGRGGNNATGTTEAYKDNPNLTGAQKEAIANADSPVSSDMKLIAPGEPYPGQQNYKFNYSGGDLPQVFPEQGVLKRIKPIQPSSLVSRIVGMLSFGLIDLGKFQDVKLQNFAFVEDREYGYGLNVDLQNGFVNIYQNWEKWPQPQGGVQCMSIEACAQPLPTPLTIEQLPSDAEAIQIADAFLAEYSVSKEGYGAPVVINSWRMEYERSADKASYYIPEYVQVVYPLILESKAVYDEGGNVTGMYVMVDARTKRATSLSELTTKQFTISQYKGETDTKRIMEVAERGGFRNYAYYYDGTTTKNSTLELDTPTIEMIKIWYSADNYRTNDELFVPAFVFPIKNWEATGYYRKNVIVPLVSDILDSDQNYGQPIPLDAPMPVEPDGGNGSSSSPGSSGSTEPAVLPEARG